MPPRKSHKKSRAGCQICKQRKIKCDEVHPVCGNCFKHGVACDFEHPSILTRKPQRLQSNASNIQTSSPSSSSSSDLSVVPIYRSPGIDAASSSPRTSHALEMRLLHNYTARTSKTLVDANTPATIEAWQLAVPDMAFTSPCLMDAVLAVSALHLRSLQPDDQSLIRAFHSYMASAISQYSATLMKGVNELNAEVLFSTSALIAFQAAASRHFQNEDGKRDYDEDGYSLPLQWFHAFQGVKTVVMASWKWLRESERVRPIIQSQPALALDLDAGRTKFFGPLLEGLEEQLANVVEPSRGETRQAYEHSIAYLNWCHQKPERSRILGFPATVSRRFVELIGQRDPRTLLIVSSFFAMTKIVDDVWWLKGVAKKEVIGIMSLLPEDWWPRMDWAIRIVNHEGPMDEETWGDRFDIEGSLTSEKNVVGDVSSHIDILAQILPPID